MYCGQCGKKVMDNMLFCPFCGSPIVIPEQDEPLTLAPEKEAVPEKEARQISLFANDDAVQESEIEDDAAEEIDFEPLRFSFDDEDDEDEVSDREFAAAFDDEAADENFVPDLLIVEEESIEALEDETEEAKPEPVKPVPQDKPRAPEMNRKRASKTYIPVKEVDMENLFMDDESHEAEDEYDLPEDFDDEFERDFEFEEPEEGSFVQRHIRGIVGLILMLVLAIIILIWALSAKGQVTLAKLNLAWNPEIYADLGYEAYQSDSDLLAARYYEKALARDTENYDYAHSAMVAYYEADRIESAAAMLKKCVEMRPDSVEPYQEMLILYPDAANRPWEIRELIRMGYERTGDASLKIE